VRMGMKWQGGEKAFIGLESSIRLFLRAYVRLLFTSGPKAALYVWVLSMGNSKSSIRLVLWSLRLHPIHRVWRTNVSIRPVVPLRTFALKDKIIHPPTLAYIQSKSPISLKCPLANPSDPKSKSTL
jgi:hypothetical protein